MIGCCTSTSVLYSWLHPCVSMSGKGRSWLGSHLLLRACVAADRQSRTGISLLRCRQHGISISSTQPASQRTQCSLTEEMLNWLEDIRQNTLYQEHNQHTHINKKQQNLTAASLPPPHQSVQQILRKGSITSMRKIFHYLTTPLI